MVWDMLREIPEVQHSQHRTRSVISSTSPPPHDKDRISHNGVSKVVWNGGQRSLAPNNSIRPTGLGDPGSNSLCPQILHSTMTCLTPETKDTAGIGQTCLIYPVLCQSSVRLVSKGLKSSYGSGAITSACN